jgi:hypothetical protein
VINITVDLGPAVPFITASTALVAAIGSITTGRIGIRGRRQLSEKFDATAGKLDDVAQVVDAVKGEVTAVAGQSSLVTLAGEAEGRRIESDIPREARTRHQQEYVDRLPPNPVRGGRRHRDPPTHYLSEP